jgi:hypothetical protein
MTVEMISATTNIKSVSTSDAIGVPSSFIGKKSFSILQNLKSGNG